MGRVDYLNFDLKILRNGTGYRAHVIDSPSGEATGDFILPFDRPALDDLRAHFSEYAGASDASSASSIREFGERLYSAVFAGDVGIGLRLSQQEAERQGKGLRIHLRLDPNATELGMVPWEVLYAPGWQRFLAMWQSLSVVRYVEAMYPKPAIRVKPPLRILAVTSSPRDVVQLDVEQEWQRLHEAVARLPGQVVLERLPRATLVALTDRMRLGNVHLLHFVGHGLVVDTSGYGALLFEDESGHAAVVDAPLLAEQLRDTGVRLIFLNACEGAASGFDDPFASVAQTLVRAGIPLVISMQFPVSDRAGVTLAHTFYKALAENYPADAALTEARREVYRGDSQAEWATPVLFSRLADNSLFDLTETSTTLLPDVPSPYRGLGVFEEVHTTNYFGREAMLKKLLARLAETRFVALVGPSGSGKSSLLRAGLLPALKEGRALPGSQRWEVETFRPGEDPLAALLLHLADRLDPGLPQADCAERAVELAQQLAQGELLVDDLLNQMQLAGRLVLVVDQFEEALLTPFEASRDRFLAVLLALARRSWATVLIAFRADYFGRVLELAELGKYVDAGLVSVIPMEREELASAIEKPAAKAGRRFEAGLVARILEAIVQEPGQLPLLEFALTRLWNRQTPEGLLTHVAYSEIGEVEGAIALHAEEVLGTFQPQDQETVRAIFTRLVRVAQPSEGTQDGKRRIDLSALDRSRWPLVQRLVDARLLVTDWDVRSQTQTIEIAHEALIRRWTTLRQWMQADREFRLWQDQLEAALRLWAENREPETLLRGRTLDRAEEWLGRRGADLADPEREFIQASLKEQERVRKEKQAEEDRRQRLAYVQEQNAYQGQLVFGALGTAIGFGLLFTLEYSVSSVKLPDLPSIPVWDLVGSFLLFSPLGLVIGAAIGLSLWRWRTQTLFSTRRLPSRKMLAVGAAGAIAGGACYFVFALLATRTSQSSLVDVLRYALSGLILGGGLGLGIGFAERPRQRLLSAIVFSLGAAVLAFAVRPATDAFWLAPIIAGALIGVFGGLGFSLAPAHSVFALEGGVDEPQQD